MHELAVWAAVRVRVPLLPFTILFLENQYLDLHAQHGRAHVCRILHTCVCVRALFCVGVSEAAAGARVLGANAVTMAHGRSNTCVFAGVGDLAAGDGCCHLLHAGQKATLSGARCWVALPHATG